MNCFRASFCPARARAALVAGKAAPASAASAASWAPAPAPGPDDGQPGDEPTGQKLKDAVVRFKGSELMNLIPKAAGGEAIELGFDSHDEPAGASKCPTSPFLFPMSWALGADGTISEWASDFLLLSSCGMRRKLDFLAGVTALFTAP